MKMLFNAPSQLYPEVDYQTLMSQMRHHSHPRRKLKDLQNKGQLFHLKKGFYVLSKDLVHRDYSPQIIANTLYGPSYLSLEYALAFYHLIPERVYAFTSVTTQKNKLYQTPVGVYSYAHLSRELYPIEVSLQKTPDNRSFLIATPAKALMDMFTLRFSNADLPRPKDVAAALIEDLRIDLDEFKKICSPASLHRLRPHYAHRRWNRQVIRFLLENL